jgi:hypothetical protein
MRELRLVDIQDNKIYHFAEPVGAQGRIWDFAPKNICDECKRIKTTMEVVDA